MTLLGQNYKVYLLRGRKQAFPTYFAFVERKRKIATKVRTEIRVSATGDLTRRHKPSWDSMMPHEADSMRLNGNS